MTHKELGLFLAKALLEQDIAEVQHQNTDDTLQAYVSTKETEIEQAASVFNTPIPDIRYAFIVGNLVVLSDDIWDKLENIDNNTGNDGPPLVLNYDKDKYYLVSGGDVLRSYKKMGKIPKVLLGVLDLKGPKPWPLKETKLNESETGTIGEFIKFAIKNLAIQKPPQKLTLSYDTAQAQDKSSFGYFDPSNNKIWIYCKNRNMADVLRTLAHELVHRKQDEDGRINYESGETGSDIENEANAKAGVLLRDFGKQHKQIYDMLLKEGMYGDYLWADKDSGVSILWYKDELEQDTPAEADLFKILKKYADSEADVYTNISLDSFIPLFKKLKKEYPEIADPELSGNTYIYRGTYISKEKAAEWMDSPEAVETKDYIYVPDRIYSSRRKVSSWSTNLYSASGFALNTGSEKTPILQLKKEGVPVIFRALAKDADLYFKPDFMDKLSTQYEDETFNITNPIKADAIFIKDYKDEFEDIEAGYKHTKQDK